MDMLKKLLIALIALTGTFTVGYAYYNGNLGASTNSYHAGGDVVGRINIAPANFTNVGSNIGLKKGDKVYIDVKNPSNNSDMIMQLVWNNALYQSWLSFSYESVGNINPLDATNMSNYQTVYFQGSAYQYFPYSLSSLKMIVDQLNNSNSSITKKVDLTPYNNIARAYSSLGFPHYREQVMQEVKDIDGSNFFLPSSLVYAGYHAGSFCTFGDIALTERDLSYFEEYYNLYNQAYNLNLTWYYYSPNGTVIGNGMSGNISSMSSPFYNQSKAIRVMSYIYTEKIVFSVSNGKNNKIAK